MALRAFQDNPSIGGFGGENTPALLLGDPNGTAHRSTIETALPPDSGDALCQIVKELVDNAVDACETARTQRTADNTRYRVKVELLPYNDDNILQVIVSDNGCGMQDIQACVNAFQSSKVGDVAKTAGRYGIGLTLCLLHAQRLVPGTYASISSATQQAENFKRALYIVETKHDSVVCHREEEVPKAKPHESGTCGGKTAEWAWKRLSSYFARFRFSQTQCCIEALAPTLSKVPIHIIPRTDDTDITADMGHDASLTEELDSKESDVESDTRTKAQKRFDPRRQFIHQAAQGFEFFQLGVEIQNVAHSEQPIRLPGEHRCKHELPKIQVDVIVSPREENPLDDDCSGACLQLIRMVNSIPLLDSAEAFACGLVKEIPNRAVWNSFGLSVQASSSTSEKSAWGQFFEVRDSDQVAPLTVGTNHQLWEADGPSEGCPTLKRKRMAPLTSLHPAQIRLGRVAAIVNICAAPNSLPLPTLSKGRLPVNHEPINQALHNCLRDCLRSLQITSPGLLLSPPELRRAEREVRYMPTLSRAVSRVLNRMTAPMSDKQEWLDRVHRWEQPNVTNPAPNDGIHESTVCTAIEERLKATILKAEIARRTPRRKARKQKKEAGDGPLGDLEDSALDENSDEERAGPVSPCNSPHRVSLECTDVESFASHSMSVYSSDLDASPCASQATNEVDARSNEFPSLVNDLEDDDWW